MLIQNIDSFSKEFLKLAEQKRKQQEEIADNWKNSSDVCKVYNMQEKDGYRIEKCPCPIVYLEYNNKKIPVDLFFSFGGFVIY